MSLDTYITAHAGDVSRRVRYLVKIFFDTPVYWTTSEIPIVALSQTWTPAAVTVSGIGEREGQVAGSAHLDIGDADGTVSSKILASSPVGVLVRIYEVWLDPSADNTIATGTKLVYDGRIGKPSAARRGATMDGTYELVPICDLPSKKVPRHWLGAKCDFTFKGSACQSDGTDTTCDHAFTTCTQPTKRSGSPLGGNRINFGGFLGIPPDGTVITWGDGTFTLRAAPKKIS